MVDSVRVKQCTDVISKNEGAHPVASGDNKGKATSIAVKDRHPDVTRLARFTENCEYSKEDLNRIYTAQGRSAGQARTTLVQRGLSYSEAVASIELKIENGIRFPNGFWANPDTAEHMIQAALDRVPGFAQARKNCYIKTMASIYRREVIEYEPQNPRNRDRGQMTFFKEHGLGGLITTDSASYLSSRGSAAALLELAIPDLVDSENPNALQPYEILADFWNDPENARKYILKALDSIPGFQQAREQNDIGTMSNLYRTHVIEHSAKSGSQGRLASQGGQISFFMEKGLSGLIGNPRPFFNGDVSNSPIQLLKFAIPSLVDDNNPVALNELDVRHDYWTEPDNAKKHVLQALYTISEFTEAHTNMDVGTMARLYRENVLSYQSTSDGKYKGGQIAFFVDNGMQGLFSRPRAYLDKYCSPAALLRITIPELVDTNNPAALQFNEIEQNKNGSVLVEGQPGT